MNHNVTPPGLPAQESSLRAPDSNAHGFTHLPPTHATRRGAWGNTYLGGIYYPADPHPSDFDIVDIAHALSLQCRFGGHCREFYSVAEHSVRVSHACALEDALWGLLHDASEAYLVDIPRPAKVHLPEYLRMEQRVMAAICTRWNLPAKMPLSVHEADESILAMEARDLMYPNAYKTWDLSISPPEGEFILQPLSPKQAEEAFLARFTELGAGGGE
jgi:hypothetical protein